MNDYFSLEWSPSQKLFHVGPLQEALTNNLRNFMTDGKTDDWSIVFVGTEKGCDHIAETLDKTARKYYYSSPEAHSVTKELDNVKRAIHCTIVKTSKHVNELMAICESEQAKNALLSVDCCLRNSSFSDNILKEMMPKLPS